MKSTVLLLFVFGCLLLPGKAQTIMTFQEMEKNGISMTKLDSIYPNATHADKNLGVFKGKKEEKFSKAWVDFYTELMTYFGKNGLIWGKQTYCFNKIYFSKEGKVAYWFFNFKQADNIPQEKQETYSKLLKEFSNKYQIKIKSKSNFSQCASVDFIDN